jgi:hypothetical protein
MSWPAVGAAVDTGDFTAVVACKPPGAASSLLLSLQSEPLLLLLRLLESAM